MTNPLLRGRTWYPTNTTPLPYPHAKSGLPRGQHVTRANVTRRHAGWYTTTPGQVALSAAWAIASGVVLGILVVLVVVGVR